MASLKLIQSHVPSSTLLSFLRSQAEDICYFTPNGSRDCTALHRAENVLRKFRVSRAPIVSTYLGRVGLPKEKPFQLQASLFTLSGARKSRQRERVRLRSSGRVPIYDSSWERIKLGQKCHASLWRSAQWAQRLMGRTFPQKGSELKADDLFPSAEAQTDHGAPVFGRTKPANELKLRCTEFDENGNVTLVHGEFKKQELIQRYGLLPRDLRKIDSSMLPHILVRQSAILINLLHLHVLIKHNRVLVFDVYGSTDSYSQSVFMYDLEHKLRQKDHPRQEGSLTYEFRALEAVLISVTSGLEQEFEQVRVPIVRVLRDLEEDIDREKLRHLLIYSKRIGTFEQRARLVRDAIDNLLEEDDDLAAMYLTETAHGKPRGKDDHTEVEMLLESYHKVCDEIVQASTNLVTNIRNTEEIVKAILDANRNALMLLDLKFSIGTLGIGSGAFVAALYGMNLKNYMEDSVYGFVGVTGFSFLFATMVCSYGLTKLRRLQRVSMWGEQGKKNRGSWRDIDPMPALPGETARERWQRLQKMRKQAIKRGRLDEGIDLPVVMEKK